MRLPLDPPAPLYVIHGAEDMLRMEALAAITRAVVNPDTADFNHDRFDGNRCSPAEVVAVAQTLPMMAQYRLVVVRNAGRMKSADAAPLMAYAAEPSPSTVLVLEGDGLDLRRNPTAACKRAGAVMVPCKPLYERDALPWLKERARQMGWSVTPEAAQFLVAYVGTGLADLAAELEKAATYSGSAGAVDLDAVRETVGGGRVHSVFELVDALGERHGGRALTALTSLLDDGEAPLRVQGMIVRQYRLIWRAKEAVAAGSGGDLAKALAVPPFVARKLGGQARRYQERELTRAMGGFAQVDWDLKGGKASPRRVLERQVLALCGPPQRAGSMGSPQVARGDRVSRGR